MRGYVEAAPHHTRTHRIRWARWLWEGEGGVQSSLCSLRPPPARGLHLQQQPAPLVCRCM